MNLEEAKEFLNDCKRMELRDHAFGDYEVWWYKEEMDVAEGYFGGSSSYVIISYSNVGFKADEARQLQHCGNLDEVWRNDSTDPNIFKEGEIMKGLRSEDVLKEITSG